MNGGDVIPLNEVPKKKMAAPPPVTGVAQDPSITHRIATSRHPIDPGDQHAMV